MQLKGEISIKIDGTGVSIQIGDPRASIDFLQITLTTDQFCAAMGRRMHTDCNLQFRGIDKIGTVHENRTFEFPLPEELHGWTKEKRELTAAHARKLLEDYESGEWVSDDYFNSQNSFFEKEGEKWARVTIRRWVDPEETRDKTTDDGSN